MELNKVKELIGIMQANDLSEIEIVDGQTRILLKRGHTQSPPQIVAMTPALAPEATPAATQPAPDKTVAGPAAAQPPENLAEIVSPIVGTFYATPSPNASPFVEIGDRVDEETVVCVIEAMKVMNEIKSGLKGTVKEILVTNGSAVEFGQPLFLVEPD